MASKDVAIFSVGIILGFLVSLNYWLEIKTERHISKTVTPILSKVETFSEVISPILADELFDQVKVMCMVMTHPGNHETKAPHVFKTWGKRCNKIYFVSREVVPDLPTILLELPDSRELLWNKTRDTYEYVHKNHLDDADWFMKVDDDSYIVVENLRQLLFSYDSNRSLIFGHKFNVDPCYMSGGAYILSKGAVKEFVEEILPNDAGCRNGPSDGTEDWGMGSCLKDHALLVDTRDEAKQQRFFPFGVESHFEQEQWKNRFDYADWYYGINFYKVSQGSLDCCSNTFVHSHYIGPQEMYMLDYLIYEVLPFGVDRNFNETLPREFTFEEIEKAAKESS